MNIAIIGKGTSSIITCLVLLQKNHDLTIFYDPCVSPINVGESTTPHIQELLHKTLGISIHELVDNGIFSYKTGINFINWGCGNNFHHNFSGSKIANHFETRPFNDFIHDYLEKNKIVKYIPKRVNKILLTDCGVLINNKNFDFVINCAGWEDDDNYILPIFSSVNSAKLFIDEFEYDNFHTLHLATEDGWQFGLPFPKQNIFKCGYLYDKNLISSEDIDKKIKKKIYGNFSWTPRYSKHLIKNPFVALNGNRLFFIEPLQALSLYYTYVFANLISDYLDDINDQKFDEINYRYIFEMWAYQISLAYHYQYGSIYDTKFWQQSKNNALNIIKSSFCGNDQVFKMNIERDLRYDRGYSRIGCFEISDIKQIHYGMLGEKII